MARCNGYAHGCVCDDCRDRSTPSRFCKKFTASPRAKNQMRQLRARGYTYAGVASTGLHVMEHPHQGEVAIKEQTTPEGVVMEHAMSIGIPCSRRMAERLIRRYGDFERAVEALDGIKAAALKLRAA